MPDFSPVIPQPTTGILAVATVPAGTTCLALPAEVDDIGHNVSTGETDTLRWFDSSMISFYVVDANSGRMTASTDQIAASTSSGWILSIAADGTAQLAKGAACTL
jgi:hypothetical protein